MTFGFSDPRVRTEERQHVDLLPSCFHPPAHSLTAIPVINRSHHYPRSFQASMLLSPSENGDLFRSAVSRLSSGLDALWTSIRQIVMYPPSKTLTNVLSLARQPANSPFAGGARTTDHALNTTGVSCAATIEPHFPPHRHIVAVSISMSEH